jgi:regulatory protein
MTDDAARPARPRKGWAARAAAAPAADSHTDWPSSAEPGSASAGRASAGRASAGRADAGRASAGRSSLGDSKTHQPSDEERARDICLRLLAIRPRTKAELATALRKGRIPAEVAAGLLDLYGEVGMVDDAAFARAWVTSRHHSKGLARRALAGELRRKGVDGQAVGEALDELDPATEEATARELVRRKLRTVSPRDRHERPDATLRRLVGMLARKGYGPGLAIRVVKDALAEDDVSAEFAAEMDIDALVAAVDDTEAAGER